MTLRLCTESFALVRPFKGLCHCAIVVLDKRQNLGDQVFDGGEVSALEQFACQDTEPDFDLIHPGSVLGRVVENDTVRGIAQEGGSGLHRLQDPAPAFDPQIAIKV